jgi:hypothetical protein
MYTSGMRVGGLTSLRPCDIRPTDDPQVFSIQVYANSRKKYFSFITDEAYNELQLLIKQKGIGDNELIFDQTENSIRMAILHWLKKCRIVKSGHGKNHRNAIHTTHVWRKAFRTTMSECGIGDNWAMRWMGHKVQGGLDKVYNKHAIEKQIPHYRKALPRLYVFKETVEVQDTKQIVQMRNEISELRAKIEELKQERDQASSVTSLLMHSLYSEEEIKKGKQTFGDMLERLIKKAQQLKKG